jgi:hypothetical protein
VTYVSSIHAGPYKACPVYLDVIDVSRTLERRRSRDSEELKFNPDECQLFQKGTMLGTFIAGSGNYGQRS